LAEHYLDWFHITMRITVLANMAKSLPPLPEVPDFEARIGADLDKLKWLLWHGNTFRAEEVLSWLEDDLYTEDENPPQEQVKLAKYLGEFATYIRANAHLIPNYGERHRCGEAISSALAESTVNQVISKPGQKTTDALVTDRSSALPPSPHRCPQQRPGQLLPPLVPGLHPSWRPGRDRGPLRRIGPADHRALGQLTSPGSERSPRVP
jgi:hypothetical protein